MQLEKGIDETRIPIRIQLLNDTANPQYNATFHPTFYELAGSGNEGIEANKRAPPDPIEPSSIGIVTGTSIAAAFLGLLLILFVIAFIIKRKGKSQVIQRAL